MGPVSVPIEQGELKWKIRAHAAEAKILKMQLADLQRQVQEAETALRRTAGEVIEAVQPKLPPGYAAKAFNEKDGTVAATFDPVNAGRKPPV